MENNDNHLDHVQKNEPKAFNSMMETANALLESDKMMAIAESRNISIEEAIVIYNNSI